MESPAKLDALVRVDSLSRMVPRLVGWTLIQTMRSKDHARANNWRSLKTDPSGCPD